METSIVNQPTSQPAASKSKQAGGEKKWLLWGLIGFTAILLVTAVILFFQLKKPAAPLPSPKPKPAASPQVPEIKEADTENVCELSFTVIASPIPSSCNQDCNYTVHPARTCQTGLICVTQSQLLGASGLCRNPNCPNETSCQCPSPSPSSSPEPTACFDTCDNNAECETDLSCITVGGDKRCVNPDCSSETDCSCPGVKKACFDKCENDNDCESTRRCMTVPNTNDRRCVNPACIIDTDCSCPAASPSPSPSVPITYVSPSPSLIAQTKGGQPELPEAGITGPAVLGVAAGLLMILLALLF